ncbi:MAG: GNAT family N-acetyltransferase [Solirubrobacteraceae bacterium]
MAELSVLTVRFDCRSVQSLINEWNHELGFVPKGGSTVEVGDFEWPRGTFLLATSHHEPVGCGGLRRLTPSIGEIKRLFVRHPARRRGVGRLLLVELEQHAAGLGFSKLRLDTQVGATAARSLFRSMGYESIEDYNSNSHASYWFEKQIWTITAND